MVLRESGTEKLPSTILILYTIELNEFDKNRKEAKPTAMDRKRWKETVGALPPTLDEVE